MTLKEISERLGAEGLATGRLAAYINDAVEEINMTTETHIDVQRIDITEDQRFYNLPGDQVKILDIRCKNHLNTKDEYKSIPRLIGNVMTKDADGE